MATYRVDISEPAERDLRDIVKYISSQLSAPETALSMLERIESAMLRLSDMPQRHPFASDERLAQMGYRLLRVKNYIVFFSIDQQRQIVDIERILYARRDWMRML